MNVGLCYICTAFNSENEGMANYNINSCFMIHEIDITRKLCGFWCFSLFGLKRFLLFPLLLRFIPCDFSFAFFRILCVSFVALMDGIMVLSTKQTNEPLEMNERPKKIRFESENSFAIDMVFGKFRYASSIKASPFRRRETGLQHANRLNSRMPSVKFGIFASHMRTSNWQPPIEMASEKPWIEFGIGALDCISCQIVQCF